MNLTINKNYDLFRQKNHAAIPSPMNTTVPRRSGRGIRRARLADVYPPTAHVTIATKQ